MSEGAVHLTMRSVEEVSSPCSISHAMVKASPSTSCAITCNSTVAPGVYLFGNEETIDDRLAIRRLGIAATQENKAGHIDD